MSEQQEECEAVVAFREAISATEELAREYPEVTCVMFRRHLVTWIESLDEIKKTLERYEDDMTRYLKIIGEMGKQRSAALKLADKFDKRGDFVNERGLFGLASAWHGAAKQLRTTLQTDAQEEGK